MRRRLFFAAAALTFLVLLALMVWQGSFSFSFHPADVRETMVLWAISTLIFLLAVTLAFMLFRAGIKTYIDRQQNREGSRIRWKLLLGAVALTMAPTLFSALFNYAVLNRTLEKWFTQPVRGIKMNLEDLDKSYRRVATEKVEAEAAWISLLPETAAALQSGGVDASFFRQVCESHGIRQLILTPTQGIPILACQSSQAGNGMVIQRSADIVDSGTHLGRLSIVSELTNDPALRESDIQRFMDDQSRLGGRKKFYQDTYFLMILLLTLFVVFFAAWLAQLLSRQISVPISALLGAAQQVRRGNLSYRIRVNAMDEMATLVRAFNEMTNELEANARELDARRSFTETILESIPTGVISVAGDESIERVNRALTGIFLADGVKTAKRLADLFEPEDLSEIRYLLKRARRTGAAACQLDLHRPNSVLHLAVTAASLPQSGFVMVIEDTSDLLRAQKAAAWQEVARRIAHEIKNPLTPISLCADRAARQLLRISIPIEAREILEECVQTIQQEVQTVKSLVDEFSQFSRFPTAQFAPADLNEVVESAMTVFAGRMEHISVKLKLDRSIPFVMIDREQVKRVIVNLIDNAAEAMSEPLKERNLAITTSQPSPGVIELCIADTGCGISAVDKEKLFLPYFSTKQRGTGLGLAIVSHIVTEHRGRVRVEDNQPRGARFIVEFTAILQQEPAISADESLPATLKV